MSLSRYRDLPPFIGPLSMLVHTPLRAPFYGPSGHGQRPKALTVRGLIADEVHAPGHVRCLRMAGEQRPQVGVARAGVVAAGDRLAPHGVGDQVGQEPVDFVVCPSMLLLVAKTSCFLNRQDYRLVSAQS